MAAQWSELQRELLELILEKLNLADHARFAAVCSSWRSVAVENPPINKPLYMVLSHRPRHLIRRFITSFVPSWKYARFIGTALDGWLVILIDRKDLFLLNKAFNSIIPLPPLPDPEIFRLSKAALSSPPSSCCDECTVVLRGRCREPLFYCRVGLDMSFTQISDTSAPIWDILFDKGLLYVLCSYNTIVIFDRLLNKVTQLDTLLDDIPDRLLNKVTQLDTLLDDIPDRNICTTLLISENKLMMIRDILNPIAVFKFERYKSSLVRVNDNINDNSLLLINYFCSVSITADDHKEFRRNSTVCLWEKYGTHVVDMGKDPCEAKVDDPWPLFFSMFSQSEIMKNVP